MIVARRAANVHHFTPNPFPAAHHPIHTPPTPHYHMAVIPTDAGLCGALWKDAPAQPCENPNCFIENSEPALLCRIITPGLPISELRNQLAAGCQWCNEVLGDREGNFHPEVVPDWFPDLVRFLRAYYTDAVCDTVGCDFANTWNLWRLRLDWSDLTPFQRAVLEETARIPRGEKLTYGQLAKRLHKPSAARAVGAALGANPWPVLIPCHRVVGTNGKLTGFSAPGGVDAKRRMLQRESPSLFP